MKTVDEDRHDELAEDPSADPPGAAAEGSAADGTGDPVSEPAPGDEAAGAVEHAPAADSPSAATVDEEAAGSGELPAPSEAAEPVQEAETSPVSAPAPAEELRIGLPSEELKAVIEALVFASPDPLTPKTLFKVLESEPREDVQASLDSLRRDYAQGHGGLHLVEVAGGYQIVTRPELSEWVRRLFHERKTQKLSVAALETLAVIAYKQPITAPEITEIRGVNAAGVVATLLERRLIKIAGRKQVVGRPFLYATTREFLIRFGLRDLADLPHMEDMADVLGFDAPVGLADAGPSETMLPLDTAPDPDKTLDVPAVPDADRIEN